jgi:hypothetical protein
LSAGRQEHPTLAAAESTHLHILKSRFVTLQSQTTTAKRLPFSPVQQPASHFADSDSALALEMPTYSFFRLVHRMTRLDCFVFRAQLLVCGLVALLAPSL